MKISDLNGELSIDVKATGPLEGSYSNSLSITGTEEGSTETSSFSSPFGGSGPPSLGDSIRQQVQANLAGALANLPTLPGL